VIYKIASVSFFAVALMPSNSSYLYKNLTERESPSNLCRICTLSRWSKLSGFDRPSRLGTVRWPVGSIFGPPRCVGQVSQVSFHSHPACQALPALPDLFWHGLDIPGQSDHWSIYEDASTP